MGLKQTLGWRVRPDLEYMTRQEMTIFKEMVKGGAIGFFRIAKCKCGEDIPRTKTFCSAKCAGKEVDDDQEDLDGVVD